MVGRGAKRMIEFKLERNALVSSEQKREREAHKKVKNGSAKRMFLK